MHRRRRFVLILTLIIAAADAFTGFAQAPATAESFDAFVDRAAADWVRAHPMTATTAQYFSGAEQDAVDRELSTHDALGLPFDEASRRQMVAQLEQVVAGLKRYDRSRLDPTQRVSAAMLDWIARDRIAQAAVAETRFVFEQFRGPHLRLINHLTQEHPFQKRRDVENYLVRLEKIAGLIDAARAEATRRAATGNIPPRFIIQSVIAQFDHLLKPAPAEHVLVTTLTQKSAAIAGLSDADRAAFGSGAEKIVRDSVYPAYARARAMLEGQLPASNDDAGVCHRPGGAAAYEAALKTNTTTNLSADQIHAIGLREVAKIESEMDVLLRKLGFSEGPIQKRVEQLNAGILPPLDPDPRPALLARVQEAVRDSERRSESLFNIRPKAPIVVLREPAYSEKSAAAHYSAPAPDGSRPGVYWLPMANLEPKVMWLGAGMRTTAYHEGVPGHHFQVTIQQESNLPRFRKFQPFGFISAHGEGWALYAERLADEFGWYEGDPAGRVGFLNAQLFRARRLVVDTGLHAKRWTRQQAIDYGFTAAEIERYVVWPGQATSYMIGQLRIIELREKARVALGSKFSLKEFHDVLMLTGNVPLEVLGEVVDEWVVEKLRAKS